MHDASLYRLMSWLSPAFPTGAYSHSGGLEWAVEAKLVADRASLVAWIEDCLDCGSGRNDAILFAHAYRASADGDDARLTEIAELAAALHPSRERRFEATAQGAAFRRIAAAASPCRALDRLKDISDDTLCIAVAVAVLAEGHGAPLDAALTAYLHAAVSNLVSGAQRLLPLGQTEGQKAIVALEPAVAVLVAMAEVSGGDLFDSLGSAAPMADFATLAHETQYTRLFRT